MTITEIKKLLQGEVSKEQLEEAAIYSHAKKKSKGCPKALN